MKCDNKTYILELGIVSKRLNPLIKRVVCGEIVEQKSADGGGEERADPVVGAVGPAMKVGRPHELRRLVIGARHAVGMRLREDGAMKTNIAGRCLQETKKASPSLASIRDIKRALVASDGMDSPAISLINNTKPQLDLMVRVPCWN